jgi:hypothetical protein
MVSDDPSDFRQLVIPEPSHVRQHNGLQPKLGVPPCVAHMDVRRLAALHAEEEKSITANPEYRRHSASLPCSPSSAIHAQLVTASG